MTRSTWLQSQVQSLNTKRGTKPNKHSAMSDFSTSPQSHLKNSSTTSELHETSVDSTSRERLYRDVQPHRGQNITGSTGQGMSTWDM